MAGYSRDGNVGGNRGRRANRPTGSHPLVTYFVADQDHAIHQNVLRPRIRAYLGPSAVYQRYGYAEDRRLGVGNFYKADHELTMAQLEDLVQETNLYLRNPEEYQQYLDGRVSYQRPRTSYAEYGDPGQGSSNQQYPPNGDNSSYTAGYQYSQPDGRYNTQQSGIDYSQPQQYSQTQPYPQSQQQYTQQPQASQAQYQDVYGHYNPQASGNQGRRPRGSQGTSAAVNAEGYSSYEQGGSSSAVYPNAHGAASSSSLQAQAGSVPGSAQNSYSTQYNTDSTAGGYGQDPSQQGTYGPGYYTNQ